LEAIQLGAQNSTHKALSSSSFYVFQKVLDVGEKSKFLGF
jgi:hypothetical protein